MERWIGGLGSGVLERRRRARLEDFPTFDRDSRAQGVLTACLLLNRTLAL